VAGVVFVNPGSGQDGSVGLEEIANALPGFRLVEMDDPGRLGDLLDEALGCGEEPIAVAGGDGTLRGAAEVLAGTSVAFLPIPAGTRNHFAREVGLEDLDRVAEALASGGRRQVTVGFVNDRAFVNNASIGLYPALVRRRERSSLPKFVAGLKAAAQLLRHGYPIEVELDGKKLEAWLVFVGNGRYGDGFTDLIERESLDEGILDVRVVLSEPPLSRLRVVIHTLLGRLRKSHLVVAHEAASLSIGVEGRHLDVALDGEVIEMEAPLYFEARRSALTVMVPGGD
jgi:diacylglycerol kinase family enzyme